MMVVEDCAKAAPMTKAAAPGTPASQAATPTAAVVSATCPVPRPSTWWRSAFSCGSEKFRPIVNNRNTTPNSASASNSGTWMVGPTVCGPRMTPTSR